MPLYDFHCADCNSDFEEIQGAEVAAPPCPACGSAKTSRLASAPAPGKSGKFPFKISPPRPKVKAAKGGGKC